MCDRHAQRRLPSGGRAAEFAHLPPVGIAAASYSQWKFFFARAYQRRLSLYIAEADYRPDQDTPTGGDLPELQKAVVAHIKEAGLHYTPFSNRDQLRAEILKEPWPEKPRAKPIVLPYAALAACSRAARRFCAGYAAA